MKKIRKETRPSMPFREWMWKIVKSAYYADDDAMSRAEENLLKTN